MFWVFFHIFVLSMLWLDFRLTGKIAWRVVFWIALALGFNGLIWWMRGLHDAMTFFTAYVIESSLSIDNLFIIFLIFSVLDIPKIYQKKVLLLGILGAFFFRIIFILLGITLLGAFSWMYPVFGAILCVSAWLAAKTEKVKIENTLVFRVVKKVIPFEKGDSKGKFFLKKAGKWHATKLFFALALVEMFDCVFAVDSVPAVLSITQDPFLAYTSNVFAVLGLRSFYLALSKWQEKFPHLRSAISLILFFIGAKMIVAPWFHVPTAISLAVVVGIIAISLLIHRLKPAK